VARARVSNLVDAWDYCGTNRRHPLFDMRLLFDSPMAFLVVGYILELAKIWQPYCTCISNIQ
jgi:hypothetical protein